MDFEHYRKLLASPDWQHSGHSAAPHIQQWLEHQGSLTRKLQQICQTLSVEVIEQGWQEKLPSKSTALCDLSNNPTAKIWRREVVLKGDGQAWIFAQTELPQHTVENAAQYVLQLGNEPIGLWLFKQPMQRTALSWRQDSITGLYARNSSFELKGYPLQIKELFLPYFSFPS
ncbi:chorismate--pyruvate lyase family protein [Avibacterium paragallinarum]|uniref:chorismate--pyruvate lyase family protein n=1 Tax=Avibacterium paragallinarum TaxID=728 RepID=UPI00397A1E05